MYRENEPAGASSTSPDLPSWYTPRTQVANLTTFCLIFEANSVALVSIVFHCIIAYCMTNTMTVLFAFCVHCVVQ